MFRPAIKLAFAALLLFGSAAGIFLYGRHDATAEKLAAAEKRNEQLRQVVKNLTTERRVADVMVTEQAPDPATGRLRTTLLFVEYARDGSPLPGKRFTLDGDVAHLDAMVVKFDGKFVQDNDPLRGHSIALFTRLYGETQAPQYAFPIDAPNAVPDVYRGAVKESADQAAFEKDLWQNFWRLADDAAYRKSMGVRVAQGEGVWSPFQPGKLYTLTIESNGGLNLTSEPVKGIYREALKAGAPTAAPAPRSE